MKLLETRIVEVTGRLLLMPAPAYRRAGGLTLAIEAGEKDAGLNYSHEAVQKLDMKKEDNIQCVLDEERRDK